MPRRLFVKDSFVQAFVFGKLEAFERYKRLAIIRESMLDKICGFPARLCLTRDQKRSRHMTPDIDTLVVGGVSRTRGSRNLRS